MSKQIGASVNRFHGIGRVVGNPNINGGWARLNFKTTVPDNGSGQWVDEEHMVPLITNNPKTVETIQKFVADERQLYVEGYVTSWQGQAGMECAVKITTIKLMAKTMYDPDAQQGQNQGYQNQGGSPNMPPSM